MTTLADRFISESNFNAELAMTNLYHTYSISRWFYKLGQPIVPDKFYDQIHKAFIEEGIATDLTSSHYEDDNFPYDSFIHYGVDCEPYELAENNYKILSKTSRLSKWETELQDEESKSIYPLESISQAWSWFYDKLGKEIVLSLKVDGINTKNLYALTDSNQLRHEVSATRSRSGSGIDITENMSKVLPKTLNLDKQESQTVFIRGEAYVPSKALPYLRDKYNQPYKIPRSTGLSAIRVGFNPEDMHLLKLKVFKVGLGDTVSEGYEIAKSLGFDTPPYEVIKVPAHLTAETFEEWLNPILDKYKKIGTEEDIPSDGLVAQINNLTDFNERGSFGNYNHGAIAIKFGPWQSGIYQGIVTRIQIVPKRENCSYVATIEPVTVASGVDVKRVNIFNADIMIANNIKVGSVITFEYKSESSVNLIYK